ncbi:hypothetical protein FHG87_017019 [Trinorchestia longiramus]|nr:hypothetical protein FHG87_017019 [Trinorchestia longiramus]
MGRSHTERRKRWAAILAGKTLDAWRADQEKEKVLAQQRREEQAEKQRKMDAFRMEKRVLKEEAMKHKTELKRLAKIARENAKAEERRCRTEEKKEKRLRKKEQLEKVRHEHRHFEVKKEIEKTASSVKESVTSTTSSEMMTESTSSIHVAEISESAEKVNESALCNKLAQIYNKSSSDLVVEYDDAARVIPAHMNNDATSRIPVQANESVIREIMSQADHNVAHDSKREILGAMAMNDCVDPEILGEANKETVSEFNNVSEVIIPEVFVHSDLCYGTNSENYSKAPGQTSDPAMDGNDLVIIDGTAREEDDNCPPNIASPMKRSIAHPVRGQECTLSDDDKCEGTVFETVDGVYDHCIDDLSLALSDGDQECEIQVRVTNSRNGDLETINEVERENDQPTVPMTCDNHNSVMIVLGQHMNNCQVQPRPAAVNRSKMNNKKFNCVDDDDCNKENRPTAVTVESALAELDSLPDGDNDPCSDHLEGDVHDKQDAAELPAATLEEASESLVAVENGDPSPPSSPRSVEGFITSVELNTAQEQYSNIDRPQQEATKQQSGPFSVYVSSSPEPASLDPLNSAIEASTCETSAVEEARISDTSGLSSSSPVTVEASQDLADQGVEIVHAQSVVEVEAPPSPTDMASPQPQSTTSEEQFLAQSMDGVSSPTAFTQAPPLEDLMSTSMILENPISDAPEQVEQMMQFVGGDSEVRFNSYQESETAQVVHISSDSERIFSPETENLLDGEYSGRSSAHAEVPASPNEAPLSPLATPFVPSEIPLSPHAPVFSPRESPLSPEAAPFSPSGAQSPEFSPDEAPSPPAVVPRSPALNVDVGSPEAEDILVEQMNQANLNASHQTDEPVCFEAVTADIPALESVPDVEDMKEDAPAASAIPEELLTTPVSDVTPCTPIKAPMIDDRPVSPIHTPKADVPLRDEEIISEIVPPKVEEAANKKAPVKPAPRTTGVTARPRVAPGSAKLTSAKSTTPSSAKSATSSSVKPGTPRPTTRTTPATGSKDSTDSKSDTTTTTTTTRTTTTARVPLTRKPLYPGPKAAAGAKPSEADKKDIKNSTNKMLSSASRSSTLTRTTTRTTTTNTAPTHKPVATKTTSTTRKVTNSTTGLKSRAPVSLKNKTTTEKPAVIASESQKEIDEVSSPETKGEEVKIAQEENSIEVLTKEGDQIHLNGDAEEAITAATTTAEQVLVNGDGDH